MVKRALAILVPLCMMPVMAYSAWTLNTWVKSQGGGIVVRGGAPQTSANSSVFNTYTTSTSFTVAVNPDTGYSVSQVNYNNVVTANPGQTVFTVHGPTSQNVWATFAPRPISMTATAGAGGSVNLAGIGNIYYGSVLHAPRYFIFTPQQGFNVVSIGNVPVGATVSPAVPAAANKPVTVTLPDGFTFTANCALTGTFSGPPVARTGPPQVVRTGTTVTLDGSSSTGTLAADGSVVPVTSFIWNQVSGPGFPATKVLSDSTSGITATFIPAVAGTYTFSLTVTGGSTAITSVSVADSSPVALVRTQCQNCHSGNGIGTARNVFALWSSSQHKTSFVSCSRCHAGTDTGGHPGTLIGGTVNEFTFDYTKPAYGTGNFCITCHSPSIITDFAASPHFAPAGSASCGYCHAQGVHNPAAACIDCHSPTNSLGLPWPPAGLDFHTDYNGTNLCSTCHGLHNPAAVTGMSIAAHYNNITSAGYPASYVTSRAACTNCHVSTAANKSVRHQWAQSGHAATAGLPWGEYDFKTMSGCVQCHTTTGFVAYSTGKVATAWGVASDKTKEVLTCIGCHSDVANGTVRRVSPVKPFANDTYLNRDVATSNICMDCHSGRNNGLSITSADFTGQAFIAPHYQAAGGMLHGGGGYNFPGRSYACYSSNTHRTIGMGNSNGTGTDGPCVGCHMTAPRKHLFTAVSTATGGTIGKVTTGTCASCHGSSLDDATLLNSRRASFANALLVLNQTLAKRGFAYAPDYPYFTATNWGSGQTGAGNMGAAFNYVLLLREPGAYVHNPAYTKQLLFDSIDYLYNGMITGSVDTAALVTYNFITQAQADSLIKYQNSSSCSSCHANTSGSHPAHLNSGIGCVDCHTATAASNTALVPGNSTHLNGVVDISFKNPGPAYRAGLPDPTYDAAAKTCKNVACHSVPVGTYSYYFPGGDGAAVLNTVPYGSAGPATTPAWNGAPVGDSCSVCHGNPPYSAPNQYVWHSSWHGNVSVGNQRNPDVIGYNYCSTCHPDVVTTVVNGVMHTTIKADATGKLHGNGTVEVQANFDPVRCFGCH